MENGKEHAQDLAESEPDDESSEEEVDIDLEEIAGDARQNGDEGQSTAPESASGNGKEDAADRMKRNEEGEEAGKAEAPKDKKKDEVATHQADAAPPKKHTEKKNPLREPDYEWLEVLGEGTFGEVKRARVKKTGKEYAIKIIRKKFIMEKKNKDVVFRERQILGILDAHPFIVQLHSTFQNPSSLFFVMDYCPNGELFRTFKQLGSLNLECTRYYASQIVVALEYMHSKGVMHRDLKPENILLTAKRHIKIIDFGTAKYVGRGRSGSFEGTPEYMSPEMASTFEGGTADTRCDTWSLGVIIYQFITGQLPFRGGSIWETLRKIRERDFAWPISGFPETALDLCKKLLVSEDERLGARGYEELKAHPFFEGVDWSDEKMFSSEPPPLAPMDPLPAFANSSKSPAGRQNGNPLSSSGAAVSTSLSGSSSSVPLSPSSASEQNGFETSRWSRVLDDGENIVRMGLVMKKRRMLNVKRRQLILTDRNRLLYLEPTSQRIMGSISLDSVTQAVAKDASHFVIKTKGRDYFFEDKKKEAQQWVQAINDKKK